LGELIGRPQSTVKDWEQGNASPSDPATVSALAAVLGVAEADLMEQAGLVRSAEPPTARLRDALATLAPTGETPSRARTGGSRPPAPPPIRPMPVSAPSYLEVPSQVALYRRRAIATAVSLVFLAIVLWWAVGSAGQAIAGFWNEIIGQIDI
jgi:transcriptional regulator with XRE-family HTH domain